MVLAIRQHSHLEMVVWQVAPPGEKRGPNTGAWTSGCVSMPPRTENSSMFPSTTPPSSLASDQPGTTFLNNPARNQTAHRTRGLESRARRARPSLPLLDGRVDWIPSLASHPKAPF